jgi:hypothetical protein
MKTAEMLKRAEATKATSALAIREKGSDGAVEVFPPLRATGGRSVAVAVKVIDPVAVEAIHLDLALMKWSARLVEEGLPYLLAPMMAHPDSLTWLALTEAVDQFSKVNQDDESKDDDYFWRCPSNDA